MPKLLYDLKYKVAHCHKTQHNGTNDRYFMLLINCCLILMSMINRIWFSSSNSQCHFKRPVKSHAEVSYKIEFFSMPPSQRGLNIQQCLQLVEKTYLIDAACWMGLGALFSEDTLLFFTLSDFRIYRDEHLEEYFL